MSGANLIFLFESTKQKTNYLSEQEQKAQVSKKTVERDSDAQSLLVVSKNCLFISPCWERST